MEEKKLEEMTPSEVVDAILKDERFKEALGNKNLEHLDNVIQGITKLSDSSGMSLSMWAAILILIVGCRGTSPWMPFPKMPEGVELPKSKLVVIEDFNGFISLVTDEDGEVKVFDDYNKADKEAKECQNGKVVIL